MKTFYILFFVCASLTGFSQTPLHILKGGDDYPMDAPPEQWSCSGCSCDYSHDWWLFRTASGGHVAVDPMSNDNTYHYNVVVKAAAAVGTYRLNLWHFSETASTDWDGTCYNFGGGGAIDGGYDIIIENFTVSTVPATLCAGTTRNFAAYVSSSTLANTFSVVSGGGSFTGSTYNPGAYTGPVTARVRRQYANEPDEDRTFSFTVEALPTLTFPLQAQYCADGADINLTSLGTTSSGNNNKVFTCVGGNCGGAMFYTSGSDTYLNVDWNGTSSSFSSTIRMTSTSANGCVSIIDRTIQIGYAFTLDAGSNQNVCKNAATINLNTGATNSATSPTISWTGTGVSGSNFVTSDAAVVPGNDYVMTYTVNNNSGCVKTDTKTLSVKAVPSLSLTTITSTQCNNTTINLNTTYGPKDGSTAITAVTWSSSNGTINSAINNTNKEIALSGIAAGSYPLTYAFTNANSCTSTTTQNNAIVINATPAQPTNITSNPASPACGATNFTLTGVGAAGGEEYRWYNVSDVYQGAGSNFATGVLGVGSYSFKATRRNTTTGCESTKRSISLTVQNAPGITATSDNEELCSGTGSVNLNTLFGVTPTTGTWSSTNSTINSRLSGAGNATLALSGIGAATYPVKYTVTDGCTATKDFSLIFSTGATTPVVNDTKICEPGIADLAVTSPNGSYQYTWWTAASGGSLVNTGTTFTTPFLSSNTTYYIQAENTSTGCTSGRDAALVTVVNIGVVNAGNDIGFCSNVGVTLNLAPDASPAGGTFSGPGVTGGTFNGGSLANNASYEITYSVTNNGCTKTDTRLISLGFNVVLKIDGEATVATGNQVEVEKLVKFEHNYPDAAATDWDFGDGWTSKSLIGAHYYYSVGDHTIKLKIKQSGGCENEFTFTDFVDVIGNRDIITATEDPLQSIRDEFVYPMPFNDKLLINSTITISSLQVEVISMDGRSTLTKVQSISEGSNEIITPSEALTMPQGIYVLRLRLKDSVKTIKVVKK